MEGSAERTNDDTEDYIPLVCRRFLKGINDLYKKFDPNEERDTLIILAHLGGGAVTAEVEMYDARLRVTPHEKDGLSTTTYFLLGKTVCLGEVSIDTVEPAGIEDVALTGDTPYHRTLRRLENARLLNGLLPVEVRPATTNDLTQLFAGLMRGQLIEVLEE